jgi:hypothetical protein
LELCRLLKGLCTQKHLSIFAQNFFFPILFSFFFYDSFI